MSGQECPDSLREIIRFRVEDDGDVLRKGVFLEDGLNVVGEGACFQNPSILTHLDLAAINAAFRFAGIRDPFAAMASLKGSQALDGFGLGTFGLIEIMTA